MDINEDKVDDAVLALLYLTSATEQYGTRAWKSFDWEAMNRLHEKGYISNPRCKAKSVVMTQTGAQRSAELFKAMFAR